MPPRNSIDEVIKRLTPAQSRLVRRMLRKQSKALYDIYAGQKKIPDTEIKAMTGLDGAAFATAKSRLESEIAAILGAVHHPFPANRRLQQCKNEAAGYMLLGLDAKAIGCYREAIAIAQKIEHYGECIEMHSILTTNFTNATGVPDHGQLVHFMHRQSQVDMALNWLVQALDCKAAPLDARPAVTAELLMSIAGVEFLDSPLAQLFVLRARAICHIILRDFDATGAACRALWEICKANEYLFFNPTAMDSIVASHYVLSIVLSRESDPVAGLELFQEFGKRIASLGLRPISGLKFRMLLLKAAASVKSGNLEMLTTTIDETEALASTVDPVDQKRMVQLILMCANAALRLNKPMDALRALALLYKRRSKDIGAKWMAIAGLMELAALLDSWQIDQLSGALRRVGRRLQQAGASSSFIAIVKKGFSIPLVLPSDKSLVAEQVTGALAIERSYPANDAILEGFDLDEWLQRYAKT